MKLAFCANVFRNDELVPSIYRLAELGYQGVEFWQRQLEQSRWAVLRAAVADAGMQVAQLCPYFDVVNGAERLEASLKLAQQYVRMAAECPDGPALIRVFTGPLTGTGAVASALCSQERWAAAVKGMRRICHLGQPHGVRFALETHTGTLVDTSGSVLQFLADVAADNLCVNLQAPLGGEPPAVTARRLGGHVAHLHANNEAGGRATFLAQGDYDFAEFLGAVRQNGPFDGFISVEHANHHPVWQVAVTEAEYLAGLIARFQSTAV